jgi:hypothetical protein
MERGTVCKGAVPNGPLYYNLGFWCSKNVRKYLYGFCDVFDQDIFQGHYYTSTLEITVERGYLNLLKDITRIRNHLNDWRLLSSKNNLLQKAITKGHLNVVMWIQEAIVKQTYDEMCSQSIECGQLEILKYALNNGGSFDDHSIRSAAYYGHLSILQWLIFNGKSKQVCEVLAKPFGAGIDEAIRLKIEEWKRERGTCAPL